jgi:hypothetical protein
VTISSYGVQILVADSRYGLEVKIRSTQIAHRKPSTCPHPHAHGHSHDDSKGSLKVPEAVVDVAHAGLEVYAHHGGNETFVGGASAAISLLAAVRGVQNLRGGGLEHNIEGVGNLALSAASGLVAYQSFTESHGHEAHGHAHSHGFGVVGALECAHGLAEMAVGTLETKRPERRNIGLIRIAKGAAVLGSQVIPGAAGVLQLVHLGATCTLAAMDPLH